jgi:hypothetical protein
MLDGKDRQRRATAPGYLSTPERTVTTSATLSTPYSCNSRETPHTLSSRAARSSFIQDQPQACRQLSIDGWQGDGATPLLGSPVIASLSERELQAAVRGPIAVSDQSLLVDQ